MFTLRGGPWDGPVSWRKPTTFGISFGFTLITICWVSSYLTLSPRTRSWLLGIFTADCVLEVAGITVQAWRYVPSLGLYRRRRRGASTPSSDRRRV